MRRASVLARHFTSSSSPSRTAIVTGGSRGIGRAISERLARDGYAVVVNYNSSEEAAQTVVQAIRASGGTATAVSGDLSSEAEVVRFFREVDAFRFPQLTVLVNNAGVLIGGNDLEKTGNESEYHRQMNTNVLGPLLCCREAARRMGKANGGAGGSIVNISSGAAYISGSMLYSMSKAALNSMSMNLVEPMAKQGIRVNTVSPGMTDTDMVSGVLASGFDTSIIPMGRVGKPDEIADAVSYLVSDGASYVSGANIRVSGGRPPGTHIG